MKNEITKEKQRMILTSLEEVYPERRDVDGLAAELKLPLIVVVRNCMYLKERGFVEGEIRKVGDVWQGSIKITAQGIDFLKKRTVRGEII